MQHPRFPTPSFEHPAASQPEPTHLALQKLELEQQDHWHPTGCLGFYVGLGFSTRNHERNAEDINHPGLYPLLCNTLGFPLLRLIILRLHIQSRRCRSLSCRIIHILQAFPDSMLASTYGWLWLALWICWALGSPSRHTMASNQEQNKTNINPYGFTHFYVCKGCLW